MYATTETFPPGAHNSNIDWRQFGIISCFILKNNEDYYYSEPTPRNLFLKELLDKGIYNETVHDNCVWELEQEQSVE